MMRIAVLTHIRHPIAQPFMGGMEAHSWHLARGLAARGHEVTMLASGDSTPPSGVTLLPTTPEHYDRAFPWHDFHGTDALNAHVDAVFARACDLLEGGGFDVVHNNSLHRFPPRMARWRRMPMVTSLHVPPFDGLRRAAHETPAPWNRFTVTSRAQLSSWWPRGAPDAASVLSNGIDPDLWPYVAQGDGSAVWAGRITPNKGTHLAVQAARIAGVPLTLFGTIEHRDYFEDAVRPHLDLDIRYGGHLPAAELAAAVGRASASLFTPLWDEPFGLAAVEAMACGVPVAATDMGAAREVVGDAGAMAPRDDAAALARALSRAMTVPRAAARARVETRFTLDRMIDGCLQLYGSVQDAAAGGPGFAVARGSEGAMPYGLLTEAPSVASNRP